MRRGHNNNSGPKQRTIWGTNTTKNKLTKLSRQSQVATLDSFGVVINVRVRVRDELEFPSGLPAWLQTA